MFASPGSASRLALITIVCTSCNSEYSFDRVPSAPQRYAQSAPEPTNVGTTAPNTPKPNTVCDPFSDPGYGVVTAEHGLNGKLYYTADGQPRLYSALDYPTMGTLVDADIFFSQLNVPTRQFSDGFATASGGVLKKENDETLFEFFGLQFESKIGLTSSDAPGLYQFATISDDGSVLKTGDDLDTLISNDADHSTRMICASEAVEFTGTTRLPIQLSYYQGPRHHIALVLMWRKVEPGAGNLADAECGAAGSNHFFNEFTSAPSANYQGLLNRGWKPVAPGNFFLKETSPPNPCVDA